jgi:four helix bundle protein
MNDYKFELEETWTLARELAWEIYSITNRESFREDRHLRDNIRRAAFTIMAGVAEGVERGGTMEFLHHLAEAKEEVDELHGQLQQVQGRGFINSATLMQLEMTLESLGCMISGLMTSINRQFIDFDSVSVSYQSI